MARTSRPPATRRPPAVAIRKPSSTGFRASDVTKHLENPDGAVERPTKATARALAKMLAEQAFKTGDARTLAQSILALIESLPDAQ